MNKERRVIDEIVKVTEPAGRIFSHPAVNTSTSACWNATSPAAHRFSPSTGTVLAIVLAAVAALTGCTWRRNYPYDDGSGPTAMTVDKYAAQLFERFILDARYYAVRVGSQWRGGLESGVTKTACMLAVDTGSAQPLLITLTQQLPAGNPAVKTVAQQCTLATTVAHTMLDERDPCGGSRFR